MIELLEALSAFAVLHRQELYDAWRIFVARLGPVRQEPRLF